MKYVCLEGENMQYQTDIFCRISLAVKSCIFSVLMNRYGGFYSSILIPI